MEENILTTKSYDDHYINLVKYVLWNNAELMLHELIFFEKDITKPQDYITIFEHLKNHWMTPAQQKVITDTDLYVGLIETRSKRLGMLPDFHSLCDLFEEKVKGK